MERWWTKDRQKSQMAHQTPKITSLDPNPSLWVSKVWALFSVLQPPRHAQTCQNPECIAQPQATARLTSCVAVPPRAAHCCSRCYFCLLHSLQQERLSTATAEGCTCPSALALRRGCVLLRHCQAVHRCRPQDLEQGRTWLLPHFHSCLCPGK